MVKDNIYFEKENAEAKTKEVTVSVNLTNTQIKKIKSFIGLGSATKTEAVLKALIMAAGRGSLMKGY